MRRLLDFAAAALCVVAGLYMFQATGSWLEIIGYGGATYFIGRGIAVGRQLKYQAETRDLLKRFLEGESHATDAGAEV